MLDHTVIARDLSFSNYSLVCRLYWLTCKVGGLSSADFADDYTRDMIIKATIDFDYVRGVLYEFGLPTHLLEFNYNAMNYGHGLLLTRYADRLLATHTIANLNRIYKDYRPYFKGSSTYSYRELR